MSRLLTNPKLARELHLSLKRVRNYASNIFAKQQVADRAETIIRARDAGLKPRYLFVFSLCCLFLKRQAGFKCGHFFIIF